MKLVDNAVKPSDLVTQTENRVINFESVLSTMIDKSVKLKILHLNKTIKGKLITEVKGDKHSKKWWFSVKVGKKETTWWFTSDVVRIIDKNNISIN